MRGKDKSKTNIQRDIVRSRDKLFHYQKYKKKFKHVCCFCIGKYQPRMNGYLVDRLCLLTQPDIF